MTFPAIEAFGELNLWAVATAGIAAFFVGGLWYSPALFEGVWMKANGYDQGQMKEVLSGLVPFGFAAALLAYLFTATIFAFLVHALNIQGVMGGVMLAVLIWLGFFAPAGLAITLFSPRSLLAWVIDAGGQFAFLAAMGVILTAWR